MKKKILSIVAMLLLGSGIANAQPLKRADDNNEDRRSSLFNRQTEQREPSRIGGGGGGDTPGTPLGSAVIPLAVFGTAYLLFRRKSDGSPVE